MPWALLLKPSVILGILLALSVLTNVGLVKLHSHDLTRIGQISAERDQAIAAGKACSDGVEKLRTEAGARQKAVAAALKKAQDAARSAQQKTQTTLQIQPVAPQDLCASAASLNKQKLLERRKP